MTVRVQKPPHAGSGFRSCIRVRRTCGHARVRPNFQFRLHPPCARGGRTCGKTSHKVTMSWPRHCFIFYQTLCSHTNVGQSVFTTLNFHSHFFKTSNNPPHEWRSFSETTLFQLDFSSWVLHTIGRCYPLNLRSWNALSPLALSRHRCLWTRLPFV